MKTLCSTLVVVSDDQGFAPLLATARDRGWDTVLVSEVLRAPFRLAQVDGWLDWNAAMAGNDGGETEAEEVQITLVGRPWSSSLIPHLSAA